MAEVLRYQEETPMNKRRDHKGRILRNCESQMPDKRYRYTYRDINGKQKSLYSWKLVPTDKLPAGKKDSPSLREQIDELKKLQLLGTNYAKANITVLELVERYVSQKSGVRRTTRTGYQTVINLLKREPFGSQKISSIKTSDAKIFLIYLQQEKGKGYSSIQTIRGVLRPAFQMAVDDDVLLKNPFGFQLATVVVNDSVTREAITRQQERQFLEFVKNDSHFNRYYEGVYILFKTGMRVSEFCGLTIKNLDMKNRTININHQLLRIKNKEYIIESPKTNSGTRSIPMTDDVYECFQKILANRKKPKIEPMIASCVGFLYLDKNDMPLVALHWEKYFEHICKKYNSIYRVQMPKITPHVCRHTYCSNMAKSGMNPKTLQYLMGHSDIGVTLNTYTHVKFDDAKAEILKLNTLSV